MWRSTTDRIRQEREAILEHARSQGFTVEKNEKGHFAERGDVLIWDASRIRRVCFRRARKVAGPNGDHYLMLHETYKTFTDAVDAPIPPRCRIVAKYHEGFIDRDLASAKRAGVNLDDTYDDLPKAFHALCALNRENGLGSYFTLVYTENADRHDYPMKGSIP